MLLGELDQVVLLDHRVFGEVPVVVLVVHDVVQLVYPQVVLAYLGLGL